MKKIGLSLAIVLLVCIGTACNDFEPQIGQEGSGSEVGGQGGTTRFEILDDKQKACVNEA